MIESLLAIDQLNYLSIKCSKYKKLMVFDIFGKVIKDKHNTRMKTRIIYDDILKSN